MACRTNRSGCGTCGCSPCKCNNSCCCPGSCGSNCGCNGPLYQEGCGVKTVVTSQFVDGGKYRQVKYANGCCDRIARGWVPQTYHTVQGNGPRPLSCCAGGYLNNTDSECMDSMNRCFNHVNPAAP